MSYDYTARKVLIDYGQSCYKGFTDPSLTLKELITLVNGLKKEKRIGGVVYAFTETWNDAIDTVIKELER